METPDRLVLSTFVLLTVIAIGATAYHFLVQQDYPFIVEAPCEAGAESCFVRDCSNPDDCPPNGLEAYRMFTLAAADFDQCSDNSCLTECTSGVISCEEVLCGEAQEDECAPPEAEEPFEEEEEEVTEEIEE